MRTIKVNIKENPYSIHIESGLIKKIPLILSEQNQGQKWIIITQTNLQKLYGQALFDSLYGLGFNVNMLTIPLGENAKTISQIENLYNELIKLRCDRSSILIALGGGVVGDIVGFLAATYMRGILYIQVPTTLLSMVDSSIGGKTGVNLPQGKNLIGSIYQPQTVAIDPNLLTTLPRREIISGFAEMLKYGLISSVDLFNTLSNNDFINETSDNSKLETVIEKSCKIKVEIVAKDVRENGLRRILNFGHTIGHALETYFGYNRLRHGEAVAYGMLCSSWISLKKELLSLKEWRLIEEAIARFPLPKLSEIDPKQIIDTIKHDKKNTFGKLNFVLLDDIGNAVITDQVTDSDLIQSIKKCI